MRTRLPLCLAGALLTMLLIGCAAAELIAYIGGGLPPGDGDIGGVVVASTTPAAVSTAQVPPGTDPVVGADVVLLRGQSEVGRTQTGPNGYFRFERPDTGAYTVEVTPPAGSGLRQARRQFQHRRGQQTFLTVVLEPAP